ncbi:hypothetical protein, partial [Mesorhizobium sp. M1E.F.Ca.ET.041.01.1.1]|uniref:hypothetical protein n=1 Tax=Mesorhizobium sp. M1E.F.Ca.ET.041.01.1.1 TaxID=2496759 RepID=UPI001AECB5EA
MRRRGAFSSGKGRAQIFPRAVQSLSRKHGTALILFLRNSGRKTATHFSWNCSLCLVAIPGGKPLRTFPGIALFVLSQFRAENRYALFLELLRAFQVFCGAGLAPPSPFSLS